MKILINVSKRYRYRDKGKIYPEEYKIVDIKNKFDVDEEIFLATAEYTSKHVGQNPSLSDFLDFVEEVECFAWEVKEDLEYSNDEIENILTTYKCKEIVEKLCKSLEMIKI